MNDHQNQTADPTEWQAIQPIPDGQHEVWLDIRPQLPAGKALLVVVRDGQCFHRTINIEDAEILAPLFSRATNDDPI